MSDEKEWIVTTSADRPIADIARDLTKAGFKVTQVLDEIGCITGTSDTRSLAQLRAIVGVADISPSSEIDIGPPGSPTTW